MKSVFPGVFQSGSKFLTVNLIPGFRSHSEELVQSGGREYRVWNPSRSKAAAALAKGLKNWPLKPGQKVLYLGAANGNTVSFFSDIVGKQGVLYAVEVSERSIRDLNPVAERRSNIVPILANAKLPSSYSWVEPVDLVYQDIAASDQSEIIIRNSKKFLKPGGPSLLAIKSRSIDVTKNPEEVYRKELQKLEEHFQILEKVRLDPFEKDHLFLVMKLR